MKPGKRILRWFQTLVAGGSWSEVRVAAVGDAGDVAVASERFFSVPEDGAKWVAPERLRAPGFFLTDGCLAQWNRADWQQTDPRLMAWSAMLIEAARRRAIPLYVNCAFLARAPVHNLGKAVDIVHGVFHWDMTKDEWALIHKLGLDCLDRFNAGRAVADKLSLQWGGCGSFHDPAHWQVSSPEVPLGRLDAGPPVRFTPRYILRHRAV